MEFSLSQLETRGLDLTCFFDSILETLSRVSFPVDGGTKHSGSRHASRRLRAALSLRMLESRFTSRVVEPGRERERERERLGPRRGRTGGISSVRPAGSGSF